MKSIDFTFKEKNHITGLVDDKGEPWFVAKEVCEILGLENVSRAMERLDEDEKLTLPLVRSGQKRETWITNESGVYHLIFTSNKPEAKAFRKWVTATVLPEIRKTGGFNRQHTLETTFLFQNELRRFKIKMNQASRKIESRISNIALNKHRKGSASLFDENEEEWTQILQQINDAIESFKKELQNFSGVGH